jgi:Pentapeptide repeats (8 copies)
VDQQKESRRRSTKTQLTWIGIGVVAVLFAAIVVFGGYYFEWKWTGFPKRTPWDWLDLLIIPVVLAIVGYWFNRQQQSREFAIAEQRSQHETLQAYLDQMAPLLTDEKRPLRRARPGDHLSVVAWAWTKTVLRRMGRVHKGNVLRFVNEAGLINKHSPVFHLSGADLHGADLRNSTLTDANLHRADLSEADLREADLRGADLRGADLRGADLSEAKLNGAILNKAQLGSARVSVVLPDGGTEPAEPNPADLRRADLSQANLQWAEGWTREQLDQAKSLKSATMPDGRQYEDWVKRGWLRLYPKTAKLSNIWAQAK